MSDIPEAIGGMAEGTLLGRAVEPGHGGAEGHTDEAACLNCGTPLTGSYCHACGQRAHVHRTIGAFLHELVHGALHFEGKIWHTLPPLAWKPGELTRRYIEGERARFVSPLALFLFSVFLMFAVFQATGLTAPTDIAPSADEAGEEGAAGTLAGLRAARRNIDDGNPAAPAFDAQIAELEAALAEPAPPAPSEAPAGDEDEEVLIASADGTMKLTQARSGIAFLDRAIEKWEENPSLMAYKLQANSYKFSWLLIPLSIPFVWLIFAWRRRFKAYDHAVFVTYSLCFMTLLFVALSVLWQLPVPGWLLVFASMLIPPVHIYKQLRGTYGLSRFSAFWRTMVLLGFIAIVLSLFVNLLLVLGALG